MNSEASYIDHLCSSFETGTLGVMHLKRYWEKHQLIKAGKLSSDALKNEWNTDQVLLNVLGLGLEPTITHLYQSGDNFDAFECWIRTLQDEFSSEKIDRFNELLRSSPFPIENLEQENALTSEQQAFWQENGYLIIRGAVPMEDCEAVVTLICEALGIDRLIPSTWYTNHELRQGIMVQLFKHPTLEKNRHAKKIKAVYEALWGRKDIWVNTDRVGFNPPVTETFPYQGAGLHWDMDLEQPESFGLQGLLYLTDTAVNQGAFTLVPGFHHQLPAWLATLPKGADPNQQDLHFSAAQAISAKAGDFIIWHHALPHGASPNTANQPRFVQYINYQPLVK